MSRTGNRRPERGSPGGTKADTYGTFQRDFALPEGVDTAQVAAKYANGMLEVRVNAPRAATPRMIEVKAA